MSKKEHNRIGFTLAEVLITLGIIGVVAAMTIPNLISTYRKKQIEVQAKVTYSTIQQALRFTAYDDLDYSTVADGSNQAMIDWFNTFLAPHLKVEHICVNKARGCWHQVRTLRNSNYGDENGIGGNILGFTISKGARFVIDGYNAGDIKNQFGVDMNDGSAMVFIFDANGATKPNQLGKDVFIMVWTEKGLVPAGYSKTKAQVKTECHTGDGKWCLRQVIDYGWSIPNDVWKR